MAEAPPRGGALVILYSDDLAQSERAVTAAGATIVARHEFPGGRRFHFVASGRLRARGVDQV